MGNDLHITMIQSLLFTVNTNAHFNLVLQYKLMRNSLRQNHENEKWLYISFSIFH